MRCWDRVEMHRFDLALPLAEDAIALKPTEAYAYGVAGDAVGVQNHIRSDFDDLATARERDQRTVVLRMEH